MRPLVSKTLTADNVRQGATALRALRVHQTCTDLVEVAAFGDDAQVSWMCRAGAGLRALWGV